MQSKQTHTHTGVTERKSHRGNSQLCAVNEKPACQDVPHSWMNKRGSGSRSPLGDTAGMRLRGKGNRMVETDRKPFLAWPMFELTPPAFPFLDRLCVSCLSFPPHPLQSTSTFRLPQFLQSRCLIRVIRQRRTGWGHARDGDLKVHALCCISASLSGSALGTSNQR